MLCKAVIKMFLGYFLLVPCLCQNCALGALNAQESVHLFKSLDNEALVGQSVVEEISIIISNYNNGNLNNTLLLFLKSPTKQTLSSELLDTNLVTNTYI